MRVLHFYKTALPETVGGVEQVIDQIARGTARLGVSNTVLALSRHSHNPPLIIPGYELITVKRDFEVSSTGFSIKSISIFKTLAEKADLVHYHFPWPFADIVHHLINPRIPSVLTYHSDIVRQKILSKLYSPLRKSFLESVNKIVATSPNYLATSQTLQSFLRKTAVIPIGLDRQGYPQPNLARVNSYRDQFGDRFFLFVGAFRYYKGLPVLIQAARSAPFPIVIAGSGPGEGELKALSAKYRLSNIFFLGQVSDEDRSCLLAACFCVVSPSNLRSEAFGVSLLEGAMFGKPLISCDIGTGTTYVNIQHQTGLVTPPSDSEALSTAMTWLWENPEQASRMGKKAQSRYEQIFTSRKMAESYYDLYRSLLSG